MSDIAYRIRHVTTYRYEESVAFSRNLARLRPRNDDGQTLVHSELQVEPASAHLRSHRDSHGNGVDSIVIQVPHQTLSITATSQVHRHQPPTINLDNSTPWDELRDGLIQGHGAPALHGFACASPYVPLLPLARELALPLFRPDRPVLSAALELARFIHREFRYDSTATTVATPLTHVLADRRGVCQDFAHLMLASLRCLGLSARYMSGYLETDPPPGQAKLRGSDASHAWVAVWCPIYHWVGFDPTNACLIGQRHLVLAHGRDFHDASPLKGLVIGGGQHTVSVAVDVERIPTLPTAQVSP